MFATTATTHAPTLRYGPTPYATAESLDPELAALAMQGARLAPARFGIASVPRAMATTDLAKLAEWGERFWSPAWVAYLPETAIVILKAKLSIDLTALEAQLGELPHTVTSVSPHGSRNFWFTASSVHRHTFAPGVELRRGARAIVNVPPSRHRDGGRYTWIVPPTSGEIMPLPDGWRLAATKPAGRA